MLDAQAIVEELFKREVFELVLVLHFHFNDFSLFDIFISDEILGQVEAGH
jgi:hypothetical protein